MYLFIIGYISSGFRLEPTGSNFKVNTLLKGLSRFTLDVLIFYRGENVWHQDLGTSILITKLCLLPNNLLAVIYFKQAWDPGATK